MVSFLTTSNYSDFQNQEHSHYICTNFAPLVYIHIVKGNCTHSSNTWYKHQDKPQYLVNRSAKSSPRCFLLAEKWSEALPCRYILSVGRFKSSKLNFFYILIVLHDCQLLHFKYRKSRFPSFNQMFSVMQNSATNLKHRLWNRKRPRKLLRWVKRLRYDVSASTVQTVIFNMATRLDLTFSFCVLFQGTGSPLVLSCCSSTRPAPATLSRESTSTRSNISSCLHPACAPAFTGLVSKCCLPADSFINYQLTFTLLIILIKPYTANVFRGRSQDNASYFSSLSQMGRIILHFTAIWDISLG